MKLVECPRDAIQGIKHFIPTARKAEYINQLLKVGFDTIDFGSFVSPKSIPQMADTPEVVKRLDISNTNTKLLAIVANTRGAEEACHFEQITYLGYPFSISETFQKRNSNSTIAESVDRVKEIQERCTKFKKELVIYISMGFGNPYGDEWSYEITMSWIEKLKNLGIKTFSLSDTIGVATFSTITYLFSHLVPAYPELEFGAHLHSEPVKWKKKIIAALTAGCRRFDSTIMGYGGCPMANDELVGNIPTEELIHFLPDELKSILDEDRVNRLKQSFQNMINS